MADTLEPSELDHLLTSVSAVTLDETELATFEAILKESNPQAMRTQMLNLEWEPFERFVRYLFECAGFTVEPVGSDHLHHHVDLRLYEGSAVKGRPAALVEVRHYQSALLKHRSVAEFIGNLTLAGSKRGYLVTTSTFTAPARAAAQQAAQRGITVCLVDWRHLARYLTYLRGSRITNSDARKRTPHPTPPDWLHVADGTAHRDIHETTILVVANNRGGVAKTTSTLSLALALVAKGKEVLVVDLDGQANLTAALPPPLSADGQPVTPARTLVDYFAKRASLSELVRRTRRDHLWLLAGHGELYTRDRGGGADPENELEFVRALHTLELNTPGSNATHFDWIILDTPPAQSAYTRAALAAAHVIILPAIVEPFAIRSINRLLETAETMHALMGRDGRVIGVYAVRWPRRPSQQVRSQLGGVKAATLVRDVNLFDTLIPEDGRIATANLALVEGGIRGIFAYRSSAAGRAYRELLEEIEKKVTT